MTDARIPTRRRSRRPGGWRDTGGCQCPTVANRMHKGSCWHFVRRGGSLVGWRWTAKVSEFWGTGSHRLKCFACVAFAGSCSGRQTHHSPKVPIVQYQVSNELGAGTTKVSGVKIKVGFGGSCLKRLWLPILVTRCVDGRALRGEFGGS